MSAVRLALCEFLVQSTFPNAMPKKLCRDYCEGVGHLGNASHVIIRTGYSCVCTMLILGTGTGSSWFQGANGTNASALTGVYPLSILFRSWPLEINASSTPTRLQSCLLLATVSL